MFNKEYIKLKEFEKMEIFGSYVRINKNKKLSSLTEKDYEKKIKKGYKLSATETVCKNAINSVFFSKNGKDADRYYLVSKNCLNRVKFLCKKAGLKSYIDVVLAAFNSLEYDKTEKNFRENTKVILRFVKIFKNK